MVNLPADQLITQIHSRVLTQQFISEKITLLMSTEVFTRQLITAFKTETSVDLTAH